MRRLAAVAEITLEQLTKVYPDGTQAVKALDLEVGDGELVVFVGPSGCGKTTALRMVAGLEPITEGFVRIGGQVVNTLPPKNRDIAMVFQNYALYPHMSAYKNMAFGLKLRKFERAEIDRRVRDAARVLGLEDVLGKRPRTLSGGQRQRVAMGRAIVREPRAFLMDEPLSNLDAKLRVEMRAEIARIQRDLEVTTIYVTHDQVEAMTLGDRVAVMRDGVLQQFDVPQTLYDRPTNLFVAEFIGSPAMNLVGADLVRVDGGLAVDFGDHRLSVDDELLNARSGASSLRGEAADPRHPSGGSRGREPGRGQRQREDASGGDRHPRGHGLRGVRPFRLGRATRPRRGRGGRGRQGRDRGDAGADEGERQSVRREAGPEHTRSGGRDGRARRRYRATPLLRSRDWERDLRGRSHLSTFILIHGGGDVGWYWHLVEAELRRRGHDVVAPDLPGDDDSAELTDYADAVVEAVGNRKDLVVVGQSFGAFTAPLVADRLPVDVLVLVAGMIPSPGEPPGDWWRNTGYQESVQEQAARDGGLTGNDDPYVSFYHDVPRDLAEEAISKERAHPSQAATASPWPLDAWPDVPTRFVLCTEDRFFPPDFFRRLVAERLNITPDEIASGHCPALSRPKELSDILEGYAAGQ